MSTSRAPEHQLSCTFLERASAHWYRDTLRHVTTLQARREHGGFRTLMSCKLGQTWWVAGEETCWPEISRLCTSSKMDAAILFRYAFAILDSPHSWYNLPSFMVAYTLAPYSPSLSPRMFPIIPRGASSVRHCCRENFHHVPSILVQDSHQQKGRPEALILSFKAHLPS
jgi:hypothetical protein